MDWKHRVRALFSKAALLGWLSVAVVILNWTERLETVSNIPSIVGWLLNWMKTPLGVWVGIAAGFAWLGFLVIRAKPTKSKPSLEKLSQQVAIIQGKIDVLWRGVSAPYTKVAFISTEFRGKRTLRVHFRVDTDIANLEVIRVALEISNEPVEAINWKPFRTENTQTGIATFQLSDIYTKGEYSATLKVYLHIQYLNGETSEPREYSTEPFSIQVP